MTPNEALQTLNDPDWRRFERQDSALGRVARREIRAACIVMAKHEAARARRLRGRKDSSRHGQKYRARLLDLAQWRRLAQEVSR